MPKHLSSTMENLNIPHSTSTVDVSIIDSTTWVANVPGELSMKPVPPGLERLSCPSYSFLLEHKASKRRLLFDLGTRKDFQTGFNPQFVPLLMKVMELSVKFDVADILTEHGIDLASVEAIIVSHHHFDHIGNPATFPATTKLVVGPGFKDPAASLFPGYPENSEHMETASDAFKGREVTEIRLEGGVNLGSFRAIDYFEDGSLYLLATPGHTHSHVSAVVRTTAASGGAESTFVLLGGDVVHHCACLRPITGMTLPAEIPGVEPDKPIATEAYRTVHRMGKGDNTSADGTSEWRSTPFCQIDGPDDDPVEVQRSADGVSQFDGKENIFTLIAHDPVFLDVLDFFPKSITNWKERGWKEQCHWRFLRDIKPVAGA